MSLKGKVALVTGAGSGIGAAIARRFADEGAKVCLNDINQKALEKTAAAFPEGSTVISVGDVSNPKDVERIVATAVSFGGKLDILVNDAGIDPAEPGSEKNLDIWHRVLDVNLTGPHLMMQTAIPYMIKNGGGSVINIASVAALRFIAGRSAYTASKAGLIALTQAAAVEFGPHKVRCNVICPGAIRTPLFELNSMPLANKLGKDLDEVFKLGSAFAPLRRIGRPEEIAGICNFLAGDDSSLLTGIVVVADAGSTLVDANGAAVSLILKPDEK